MTGLGAGNLDKEVSMKSPTSLLTDIRLVLLKKPSMQLPPTVADFVKISEQVKMCTPK